LLGECSITPLAHERNVVEIRSFHISEDHSVTLDMAGMPSDADTSNTSVEIAGTTQSTPEVVDVDGQTIIFSAGSADQEGAITVIVRSKAGRQVKRATSVEPYVTLHTDPENEDKVVIRAVAPTKAKPGDAVTVRGRNLKNLTELYLGYRKLPSFSPPTETSVRFNIPPMIPPDTYVIRFKDGKFSGAVEPSTARLEITAAGEG
jgi:hypothetical protein